MVHIALALDRAQVVELLRLAQGTERCERQDLRLPACKQAGAMGPWRSAHLAPDRSDLGRCAAIRALAHIDNAVTDDILLGLVKGFSNGGSRRVASCETTFRDGAHLGDDCILEGGHPAVELVLGQRPVEQLIHRSADALEDLLLQLRSGRASTTSRFGLPTSACIWNCRSING